MKAEGDLDKFINAFIQLSSKKSGVLEYLSKLLI